MGVDLYMSAETSKRSCSIQLTLNLGQLLLLDDIRHFLLLRLSLRRLLLHRRDLLVHFEHMASVGRTERCGSDKGGVGVGKWLESRSVSPFCRV